MSHKDNQDLRIRELGGWFWGEHELFTVFAPIIGPIGLSVYIAMARQIPLAAIDSDRRVRVRIISEMSCVGRSKCAEEMRKLIALGMILETKYLDGRDPSYKLESLRNLAKLGQKALLERIGVRNTDTAPYDQSLKNRREKEARKQKREETSGEDALSRELPLLDQQSNAGDAGVHVADTSDASGDQGAGVRVADTVSAEMAFVSATDVDVSAKTALVSAGADAFKREREKKELRTPLPPAERGEVGVEDPEQARASLPAPGCRFADAGFSGALPHAARWVMAELGITKRKLEPVLAEQLLLYCRKNPQTTLEDAAARMATQGRALHDDADKLRHKPWSWFNFFSAGHWTRPLPYAVSQQRGSDVPANPVRDAGFEQERAAAWIEANAATVEGAFPGEMCAHVAERLRAVATRMRHGAPIAEIDEELQALNEELVDLVMRALSEDQRAALEKYARQQVAPHVGRMNPAQLKKAEEQYMRRAASQQRGVPPLSLFYMPQWPEVSG